MLLWKQFERPRTTTYLEFSLQRAWHRLRTFPAFLFGYSIHCLRHVLCLFLERVWFFHTHFFCATRCSLVWFTMLRTTLLRTCDDHWTVTREVVVWRWKGTLRMTCCHRRILPRQWWVNLKKHFTVVYEPLADVLQCVTDVLLCAFSTRCYRNFFFRNECFESKCSEVKSSDRSNKRIRPAVKARELQGVYRCFYQDVNKSKPNLFYLWRKPAVW